MNKRQQGKYAQLEAYINEHRPGGRIAGGAVYVGNKTKMPFIDSAGHKFMMTPNTVKSGHWSSFEYGNVSDSEWHMEDLRRITAERGGRIADDAVYVNSKTKMAFIDSAGHRFILVSAIQ